MNDQMRARLRDQISNMQKRLDEILKLEASAATPESERPALQAERGLLTKKSGDMAKMLMLGGQPF